MRDETVALRVELEALYRERYREFVRVATAIVGNESSGIDVVQESFARSLAALASFRGQGSPAGWVWRILVNTARTQARRIEVPVERLEPSTNGASAAAGEGADVQRWLVLLPERQRLVVFLRYYADLDYRSIAEALEVEVGTVSATLNAAHDRLRRLMEEVPQ